MTFAFWGDVKRDLVKDVRRYGRLDFLDFHEDKLLYSFPSTDFPLLGSYTRLVFFSEHGNESCNLICSLLSQYFPISAHGPR